MFAASATNRPKSLLVRPYLDAVKLQRVTPSSAVNETTDDEQYVIDRLAEIGVRSEKIPRTSAQKTCDLRAEDDAARYVIEVKRRRSDESVRKLLREKGATACSATRWVFVINREHDGPSRKATRCDCGG